LGYRLYLQLLYAVHVCQRLQLRLSELHQPVQEVAHVAAARLQQRRDSGCADLTAVLLLLLLLGRCCW
jgi:hypothetical protein